MVSVVDEGVEEIDVFALFDDETAMKMAALDARDGVDTMDKDVPKLITSLSVVAILSLKVCDTKTVGFDVRLAGAVMISCRVQDD